MKDKKNRMSKKRIRNPTWKEDRQLKDDLRNCVLSNYRREEIVCSMGKKYPEYAWSLSSLKTRLSFFEILYNQDPDESDDLFDNAYDAVSKELEGPGKDLGYRSLHSKIRRTHGLFVSRDLVYNILSYVDDSGLKKRGGVGLSKKKKRTAAFKSSVSLISSFLTQRQLFQIWPKMIIGIVSHLACLTHPVLTMDPAN